MSDTLIKQLLNMAKIEKGLTAELLEQSAQELSAALARIKELEASKASIEAEALQSAAKDIYMDDKIIGLLEIGDDKKPDNYRAEGWFQAYNWLQRRASDLINANNINKG